MTLSIILLLIATCILILGACGVYAKVSETFDVFMLIMFFVLIIFGFVGVFHNCKDIKVNHPTELYDGNGKLIPNNIIELEVKSHFAKLKQSEKDSINKYFYFDTLK